MIDSTKTFVKAAKTLMENGATKVYVIVTHSLMSAEGFAPLEECPEIHEVKTSLLSLSRMRTKG